MKILILAMTCALFTFLKDTFSQDSLAGKYHCAGVLKSLVVNEDGNYFLLNEDPRRIYYRIDTLSFGKWKLDGDFIVLNTSKSIAGQKIDVVIEEHYKPGDSLILEISNPYENFAKKMVGEREFHYIFSIDSYSGSFGPSISMKNNRIALYKSNNDKIFSIYFIIIPNSFLYPYPLAFNYLITDNYIIKNNDANYLKVSIPKFTYEYIGYIRFNSEYVKIIDKNKLKLRGEIFERVH